MNWFKMTSKLVYLAGPVMAVQLKEPDLDRALQVLAAVDPLASERGRDQHVLQHVQLFDMALLEQPLARAFEDLKRQVLDPVGEAVLVHNRRNCLDAAKERGRPQGSASERTGRRAGVDGRRGVEHI